MDTVCKLFYRKDVYARQALPIYARRKIIVGQNSDVVDRIENFGLVTYYDGDGVPHIGNRGEDPAVPAAEVAEQSLAQLLPAEIPADWESRMPPVLGFHMHELCEINLIRKGSVMYIADGKCYPLGPGDVIYLSAFLPHGWVIDRTNDLPEVTEVCFSPTLSAPEPESDSGPQNDARSIRMLSGMIKAAVIPAGESGVDRRIENILREVTAPRFGSSYAAGSDLNLILLELIRHSEFLPNPGDRKTGQIVKAAQEYIAAHLAENPRLADIAGAVYVTPNHLSYLFKKQTGVGIAGYINRQKLLLTIRLLGKPGLSVLDVAMQSGFTSKSNFYRVFRDYYGITPQSMRSAILKKAAQE